MPPYAGKNLQGRSFKGQDLTGANFSKADIRGANFTNTILKDADFTGAKAGLQRRSAIRSLIISWMMSAVSSFFSIFMILVVVQNFDSKNTQNVIIEVVCLVVLTVFCITTICKGLIAGLKALLIAIVLGFAVTMIVPGAIVFAFFIAIVVAFSITFFVLSFAFSLTGVRILSFLIVVAVAAGGAFTGAKAFAVTFSTTVLADIIIPLETRAFAFVLVLLSACIGWGILAKDEKDTWIRSGVLACVATEGTSFCSADLTDADFTGAILENTNLRKANLTRTRFYETKKLDFARVDDSILVKRDILNLLVTGNGRGKSYAGANLKGANLIGADLTGANFKDTNITGATFQRAFLDGAILTLAQAVGTNFTSAQMTGACIEAWNIESSTQLNNVDCRFVYLLENPKPGTDDRERRPSSGKFQPGEFTKLFEEVLNTVDLIFRNGIDWKAFVTAFKKVQVENENTELAIQSIENKDGVFVIRIKVPVDADKEKIHSDCTKNYQLALQAVEKQYKAQLNMQKKEINFLRQQNAKIPEMIMSLAKQSINVQVYNKNMNNSNDYNRSFNVGNIGGDFNNSCTINLGEISGTVTNAINQLPSLPESDKPGIKELLTQLQAAIEADNDLSRKDKGKALTQVKSLAEASQNPQNEDKQNLADTAITMLQGILTSLPSATKLAEECRKLLPLISQFLGLG
ncbi:pentapeptide repeat-containing protein [Halotia wernerae UHCC 0503]|nr:pentapeptide repeat-containing protein [Halotia wernerae UHCC 0503]